MKRLIHIQTAAVMLFLFSCLTVFGQTASSSLRGVITDKSGAVVVDASVVLENPQTGYSRTLASQKDGVYQFLDLPPGTYTLTVGSAGYENSKLDKLEILVNTPATANVVLQVGATMDTVSVTATAETLNTDDATAGSAFEETQVKQLPIESRNVNDLLSLEPGVSYLGDRTDINQTTDTRSGSVNGARSDQNASTLDGIDATDQANGFAFSSVLRTTPDALQEFRVTTSNPTAAQGTSSGAQIALLTKGGTNKFHGSFYEYIRNTATSANDWFLKNSQFTSHVANKAPHLNRNVFGASIGGPIKRDKAFFFLNYEGRRDSIGSSVVTEVPLTSLRSGAVQYTNAAGGTSTVTAAQFASWDPLHIGPNTVLQNYYNSFPTSNDNSIGDGLNFGGYRFAGLTPARLDVYIARFDYKIDHAGNHTVFVRGSMQNDYTTASPPYLPGLQAQSTGEDRSKGFAVGYTAILSPSLVNEARAGLTRASVGTLGDSASPFLKPNGITGGITRSNSYLVPVWDYADNVSWTKGKHTLVFGGNFEWIKDTVSTNANSFSQAALATTYIDTGGFANEASPFNPANNGAPGVSTRSNSAYDQAAFDVLGIITEVKSVYNYNLQGGTLPIGAPVKRTYGLNQYDFYAQDSLRILPNLTINYGLLYQLESPPSEANGLQVAPTFDLGNWSNARIANMQKGIPSNQDPTVRYVLGGSKNGGPPFYNWDYKDLAPRLSIAYQPQPKTSIRAGFGVAFDHFGTEIVNTFGQNGSFGLSTSLTTPLGSQNVTCAPRVTSLTAIPSSGCPGAPFIVTAPPGGFPQTPPVGYAAGGFSSGFTADQNLKTPYSYMLNLSVGREITPSMSLEVGYIGHLAHRLASVMDFAQPMNLTDPGSGVNYYTAMSRLVDLNRQGVAVASITPALVGPTAAYWQNMEAPITAATIGKACKPGTCTPLQAIYAMEQLYPGNETFIPYYLDIPTFLCPNSCNTLGPYTFYDPQFFALNGWKNVGGSNYSALQVTLRRKLSHGLSFDVNYTYSKSMDLSSAAGRVGAGGAAKIINTFNPRQMYAVSDFDMTHQLNANWVAQLPVGRGQHWMGDAPGWMNAIVGGWQLSGLYRVTSGLPFSVSNGSNLPTNGANGGYATQIAPIAAGKATKTADGHVYLYKDPVAASKSYMFTYPGQSGTRNGVRGDGFLGLDAGLSKRWIMPYKDSNSLQFRWEVFNLGNFTRFNVNSHQPSLTTATNFGTYTGLLTNPRVMQFALRYEF